MIHWLVRFSPTLIIVMWWVASTFDTQDLVFAGLLVVALVASEVEGQRRRGL